MLEVSYLPRTDAFGKLLDAVDNALSNAGLSSPRRAQHNAQYAATDNGLSFECLDAPVPGAKYGEELADDVIVLAVEATRGSLSMSLWHTECALWELMRQAPQSFELGTTALKECREEQDPRCSQEVEDAVRQITAVPFHAGGGVYTRVGGVVVYGEGGEDRDLNEAIRTVLQEQYAESTIDHSMRPSRQGGIYTASRGLAWVMWTINEAEGARSRVELRWVNAGEISRSPIYAGR